MRKCPWRSAASQVVGEPPTLHGHGALFDLSALSGTLLPIGTTCPYVPQPFLLLFSFFFTSPCFCFQVSRLSP